MSDDVTPFSIDIGEADLADLRDRLRRTRWPEAETAGDWSQGTPLSYARELCRYWLQDYDWAAAQARLNFFPQFRTRIDDLDIHFLHVASPHVGATPLVLTHGWPGSVVEFRKVIEPLVDPVAFGGSAADAFHVVCPTLPGYGFSGKPARPGWGVERIADAWDQLMARLGYPRYGAQGGDWGSLVTTALGRRHPGHVLGIHLNFVVAFPDPGTIGDLTERERAALAAAGRHRAQGTGYAAEQSTRPQSIGYGLVDSPAALCAWIVEKFRAWSDCDGDPGNVFTREELLDNIMLYWLTGTGASAARLYWESYARRGTEPVTVPAGASIFPKEIYRPSRRWAEPQFTDLRYWSERDKGGHFAALEQPTAFVEEVRSAFRLFRDLRGRGRQDGSGGSDQTVEGPDRGSANHVEYEMKFLIALHINPVVLDALTDEEKVALGGGHGAFIEALKASGELITTQALADPSQAAVVSVRNGQPVVTDGPFLESKEYLGGST